MIKYIPRNLPSICFVAPNAFPLIAGDEKISLIGGAELQQVLVAKGLAKRGYRVTMVCLDFGQEEDVEIEGVRVIRAFDPNEGLPVLRFFWPRLTCILRCLKKADADIYYVRTASMLAGVVAAFCRRYSKKSVFAAAGNPDLERNTSRIRYARDRRIYEFGVRNVDRIFVQNEAQKHLCKSNFRRDSIIIPNLCITGDREPGCIKGYVLWVSTIRELKQPNLYLDIAEALPQYTFKMIGGGSARERELFDEVRKRAKALPNVDFLGFVPFARVEEYFSEASIFVNTSESEGFPNTFLQAWAWSVPTVSFIDSGARYGGRPVGRIAMSFVEMADIVTYWLENDKNRAEEGLRCREYVEKIHSPEIILDKYADVFDRMVLEERQ